MAALGGIYHRFAKTLFYEDGLRTNNWPYIRSASSLLSISEAWVGLQTRWIVLWAPLKSKHIRGFKELAVKILSFARYTDGG